MTIQEKADCYDEAIKVIKDNLDALNEIAETGAEVVNIQSIKNCFYRAFPELRESEDEKIRKALIEYFNEQCDMSDWNGVYGYQVVAWLEKQGEHANFRNKIQIGDKVTRNEDGVLVNLSQLKRVAKPADKVEPKFKVSDWIVQENVGVYKVIEVCESWYEVIDNKDKHYSIGFDKEYMCHLWTIQDAKDGDVLANRNIICIYKKRKSEHLIKVYSNYSLAEGVEVIDATIGDFNLYPATKEHRDTLFAKMKEAGYEWDSNSKELHKIKE